MATLWELLKNKFNNNQVGGAAPLVTGLQLDNDGNVQEVDTMPMNYDVGDNWTSRMKNGIKNFNLSDALLGKQAKPTDFSQDEADENGTISAGISASPRRGGLINDITAGSRENFNNSFRGENLVDNETSDGRQKGFAYRIGEGLGSIGRFAESPAGRALIVGGLIGATGGTPLEAMAYGASTAAQNQQNRQADSLYRNQLKNNYGMTDEELNNLRGYVNRNDFNTLASNIYKNNALKVRQDIANAKDKRTAQNLIFRAHNNGQLSDSEAQLQLQAVDFKFSDTKDGKPQLKASNSTKNADMNEELLPYKKYALQMTPQIAMGNLGLNQARFAYQQQQDAFDNALKLKKLEGANGLSNADKKTYRDNLATLTDIDAGLKLIKQNPNAYSLGKGLLPADITNRLDPKGVKTRTQIDNITAVYRKWLTGAQMSDAERKAYERFLPAPTDNAHIVEQKLQGMKDSIERKNNILMQTAKMPTNNNPLGLDL